MAAALTGLRIGYVRVSTLDQNERRHLEGQVLDRVFTDKASGRDTASPQLTEMLRFAGTRGLTRKGVWVEFVKESLVFTGRTPPGQPHALSVMDAQLFGRGSGKGQRAGNESRKPYLRHAKLE